MRNKRSLTPFGRNVRKRMIDRNLSHTELCEKIGCGKSYLTDILVGRRSGGKYIAVICDALDLPYNAERGA